VYSFCPETPVPELVPFESVTCTTTVPAVANAGVVTVMSVELTTTTLVPAPAAPKLTVAPETKPVPVNVTGVAVLVAPLLGFTSVTVGGATYVKSSAGAFTAEVPCEVVTSTFTVPAEPAGDVTVISVEVTTVTLVPAFEPKATVAPAIKFVPVNVTGVPPAVEPEDGDTPVTVGTPP
jgi:hypothetical protein